MAYHDLTRDTGQTPQRRREEADDILALIEGVVDDMTPTEQEFVNSMQERDWCSPKQLLWLRDLKEKYL